MAVVGMLIRLLLLFLLLRDSMGSIHAGMVPLGRGNGVRGHQVDLSSEWDILGPFQIGTRGAS